MNPTVGTIIAVVVLILSIALAAIGQSDIKVAGLIAGLAVARIIP